MAEICQKVLDGLGMPAEWALSIVVPIIKRKSDIINSSCYRAVKLLEHRMKVMERVLGKGFQRIVTANKGQFGTVPQRRTIDAACLGKGARRVLC